MQKLTIVAFATLWGGAALLAAAPARAGNLTFDFGELGANGGGVCQSDCVLPTHGANDFTTGGVTIAVTGYSSASGTSLSGTSYVTQKPGAPGAETGLGESDTPPPNSSDLNYEIAVGKALELDNSKALALGYSPVSVSIGSLQSGESAAIYGGTSMSDLTLLATLTGTPTEQTQNLSASDTYVVVEGVNKGNSTVISEVFKPGTSTAAVPEPMTMALLGSGLFGLAAVRRRRAVA